MTDVSTFKDILLNTNNAAIVIKEHLQPVEGFPAVIMPPTNMGEKGKESKTKNFSIYTLPDGRAACLIDSVASQGNRRENMFAERKEYQGLVPQIEIKVKDQTINLLQVSHRIADATVRCVPNSNVEALFAELHRKEILNTIKVSPTSILMGCWASRGQLRVQIPRAFRSEIRAYGVKEAEARGTFQPAADFAFLKDQISDDDKTKTEGLSKLGYNHAPTDLSGITVDENSDIIRTTVIQLNILRDYVREGNEDTTNAALYLFSLGLVAAWMPITEIRSGCHLMRNFGKGITTKLCRFTGEEHPVSFSHDGVVGFAQEMASIVGVDKLPKQEWIFDEKKALQEYKDSKKKKGNGA